MQGLRNLGCFLCRARKVKCDERWPICSNCERLELDCPGNPGQVGFPARVQKSGKRDATLTQAGTIRHRVSKSCHACRNAKSRCSGGEKCTRCYRRDIECTYSTGRGQQIQSKLTSEPNLSVHTPSSGSVITPNIPQPIQYSFQPPAESTPSSISWYILSFCSLNCDTN
jgi:hypothetical protein